MLKKDNVTLRNLQEQVLNNKQRIEEYYAVDRALANFGIKIVGTVASVDDLPDPLTYGGAFGDGYAVGTPGNYTYYIYTRPNFNAGQFNNYWLDVGAISVVGPEGPQGIQGPVGPEGKSTKWYTGESYPENPEQGDMFLNTNGNVYQYVGTAWVLIANIKGPQGVQGLRGLQGDPGEQGPQGPKGEPGDVGGFINIWGILANEEQLPTPASLDNLTVAYLIEHTGGTDQANDHYDLYIQVGESSSTATWNNVGPFNAATLVTSGGVGLNVFDADTKLDKVTTETTLDQAYCKSSDGTQKRYNVAQDGHGNAIVRRTSTGEIKCAAPTASDSAATKQYVDNSVSTKLDKPTNYISEQYTRLIGYKPNSTEIEYILAIASSQDGNQGSIVRYDSNSRLVSGTPITDVEVANKKYVDDAVASAGGGKQLYSHELIFTTTLQEDPVNLVSQQIINDSSTPYTQEILLNDFDHAILLGPVVGEGYIVLGSVLVVDIGEQDMFPATITTTSTETPITEDIIITFVRDIVTAL